MSEEKTQESQVYWRCSNCGNTLPSIRPPETCPVCNQKCEFINVTCYQPDCGFTGIDPRLK